MKKHNVRKSRKDQLNQQAKIKRTKRRKAKVIGLVEKKTVNYRKYIGQLNGVLIETQRALTAANARIEELAKPAEVQEVVNPKVDKVAE